MRITWEWRRLHNVELYELYFCYESTYYASGQIKKNEMSGACSTYGVEERYVQTFVGETLGKEKTWKTQA